MEHKCGYCGKQTLSLRRCSACKEVYYCSQVCQRGDWKCQHKVKCKDIQNCKVTEDLNKSIDTPFLPRKENRPGTVPYPAESAHGITQEMYMEHERSKGHTFYVLNDMVSGCANTYADIKEGTGGSRNKTCIVCGETSATVKTCAQCKMTDYCSKGCQKKDRKKHKQLCKDISSSEAFRPAGAHAASDVMSSIHHKPQIRDLSLRCYAEQWARDKAKSLAWKTFPGCTILDFIREIPPELCGVRPRGTNKVVVGFISRYHRYIWRHCIFLQDKDGDEVYVAFYFERDNPSPYFRWEDVVPGRYICIEDPYIHPFRDGSVGIRVDSPSAVRMFTI